MVACCLIGLCPWFLGHSAEEGIKSPLLRHGGFRVNCVSVNWAYGTMETPIAAAAAGVVSVVALSSKFNLPGSHDIATIPQPCMSVSV